MGTSVNHSGCRELNHGGSGSTSEESGAVGLVFGVLDHEFCTWETARGLCHGRFWLKR